jgi:K+-sensing histidine kinase KdpD
MSIQTRISADIADENEALQKQRETFVASLSHDLKNPTIAQIRAIELILKGKFGKVLPEQREIMEMVLNSCKYMNAMLCSVLTTYRNEKGTVNLASECVSIADLAEECTEEMIYLAKEKDIKIVLNNNAEREFVWGDTVQIRRVIMNLLSNGIKYACPKTELQVKIYNEQNYTCFMFENKSPYLSPDVQKKIFARYISFSKTHSGIGLGLYVSKKIVEAHDGIMFVQSFKQEKNIFGFKIPNNETLKNKKRSVTF